MRSPAKFSSTDSETSSEGHETVQRGTSAPIGARTPICVVLLFINFLGLARSQNCVSLPSGIQNWWRFEESSGTTANDFVGGKTGTYIGNPSSVAGGKIGRALRFDGNSYARVNDDNQWAFGTSDFTIELWAKFESPGGTLGQPADIFIGHDEGGGNTTKWWFGLGNSTLHFHVNSPIMGPQFFPLVPFAPNTTDWYHLAIVRQRDSFTSLTTFTIFINGVAQSPTASNSFNVPKANAPLTIGEAEGFRMNGLLDEVTIYNRALPAQTIQAIFNAGSFGLGKCATFGISTESVPSAQVGEPYSHALGTFFASGPVTWSATGLPPGLTFGASNGVLSGTPTQAGSFSITVTANDGVTSAQKQFVLAVDTCAFPSPNMVSWWPGDGDASDIQGNNDGAPQMGVSFASGKVGQGFSFNGSAQSFVSLPNSADMLPSSGHFTIAAWIKPNASSNAWDTILAKRDSCGSNGISYYLGVNKGDPIDPYGSLVLSMSGPSGESRARSDSPLPSDGQFHHVAGTYNGSQMMVYIDGQPARVTPLARTGPIVTTTSAPVISHHGGSCPQRANAIIDEIEFFNEALNLQQIQAIFNAGSAGNCKGSAGNHPPSVTVPPSNQSVTFNEGETATNSGSFNDPDLADNVTLSASVGEVTRSGSPSQGTWSWSYLAVDGPANQSVTITANDGRGGIGTNQFALRVENLPPTGGALNAPATNWKNIPFDISVTGVSDPSLADRNAPFTFSFECGQGTGFSPFSTTATFHCTPTSAGHFRVSAQVRDKDMTPVLTLSQEVTITEDPSPPSITPSLADGWYKQDVTLTWTVEDQESGIANSSGCQTVPINQETPGLHITCMATNNAGLSNTVERTIRLDKTPPTITASPSPAANANGWNNTNVTITFTCNDTLSGVDPESVSQPMSLSTEGANQSATGSCKDIAGNSSPPGPTITGINIDKTAPTATASRTPGPNANGWNNTAVTVTFAGTDSPSGIDVCQPAVILSADGINQSASGTCTDKAGNVSLAATLGGINIDTVAPTLVFGAANPSPNTAGWNRTNVSLPFTASDALSGVGSTIPASPLVLSAEGLSVNGSVTVTDKAGNVATLSSPSVRIDKTPPIIVITKPVNGATYLQNVAMVSSYACSDILSGIFAGGCSGPVASGSNFSTSPTGAKTFQVMASDLAGNPASLTVSYTITASGTLKVKFTVHAILDDTSRPRVGNAPVGGAEVRVFTRRDACTDGLVVTNQPKIWSKIFDGANGPADPDPGCPIASYGGGDSLYFAKGLTDANGEVNIVVPPTTSQSNTDYVVIGRSCIDPSTPNCVELDNIQTMEDIDSLYSGGQVNNLKAGDQRNVPLKRVRMFNGKKVPAKYIEETGSYLAVIEPEYVDWTSNVEKYPFVMETIEDWGVTTTIVPPEGFVSDYSSLTAQVDDTTAAVQFTLTDVGSEWSKTQVTYTIRHKGKTKVRKSEVRMFDKKPKKAK